VTLLSRPGQLEKSRARGSMIIVLRHRRDLRDRRA
jgi:hypothetical protein